LETTFRPPRRGLLLGLAAVIAFVAAGCAGPNDAYPVKGTVLLDGQPATELAGGTVTFDSAELHKSASGEIQADGTYQLSSLTKNDGAIPGTYQVTVSPPETAATGGAARGGPERNRLLSWNRKTWKLPSNARPTTFPFNWKGAKTGTR
jgi:hypothetical protein